jgi:CRISPR-associated protein Cas2
MYIVLCYDIPSDRRRTRLFKRLEAYLIPVQKSVFEGPLKSTRYEDLEKTVLDEIDLEEDTVRIYQLTPESRAASKLFGTSKDAAPEPDIVL